MKPYLHPMESLYESPLGHPCGLTVCVTYGSPLCGGCLGWGEGDMSELAERNGVSRLCFLESRSILVVPNWYPKKVLL